MNSEEFASLKRPRPSSCCESTIYQVLTSSFLSEAQKKEKLRVLIHDAKVIQCLMNIIKIPNPITSLPPEIRKDVLYSYLTKKDILSLSKTQKTLHQQGMAQLAQREKKCQLIIDQIINFLLNIGYEKVECSIHKVQYDNVSSIIDVYGIKLNSSPPDCEIRVLMSHHNFQNKCRSRIHRLKVRNEEEKIELKSLIDKYAVYCGFTPILVGDTLIFKILSKPYRELW